jgi:hypothetical protein
VLIGLVLLLCLATVPARGRAARCARGPALPRRSVGDVVLVVAALLALHCLCGSRLAFARFASPLAR